MIKLVHGDGTICQHRHMMLTFAITAPTVLELDPSAPPGAQVCPDVQFAVARHGGGPPYIAWRRTPAPAGETVRPWGLRGAQMIHQPFDAAAARALLAVQTAEERLEAAAAYIAARFARWADPVTAYGTERTYTWYDNQEPLVPDPLRFECVHQASNFRPCPEGCNAWPTG